MASCHSVSPATADIYTSLSSGEVFYGGMGAYACDTGSLSGGKVYRYRIENGVPVFNKDITPEDHIPCGYSGICSNGKMLLLSTVCRKNGGDIIYTSTDSGESWKIIMNRLEYSCLPLRYSTALSTLFLTSSREKSL